MTVGARANLGFDQQCCRARANILQRVYTHKCQKTPVIETKTHSNKTKRHKLTITKQEEIKTTNKKYLQTMTQKENV